MPARLTLRTLLGETVRLTACPVALPLKYEIPLSARAGAALTAQMPPMVAAAVASRKARNELRVIVVN